MKKSNTEKTLFIFNQGISRFVVALFGPLVFCGHTHFHPATEGIKHWFLPENQLHLEVPVIQNDMTQEQFQKTIDDIKSLYCPIFESYGAGCDISGEWESTIVNAYAMRYDGNWVIALYGGLARRHELSPDGFAAVACHEVGHHIAGFAFKSFVLGDNWAATEGQSDYFAAHACLPELWRDETLINASFRSQALPLAKAKCDSVWTRLDDQNLCYRITSAVQTVALMIARSSGRFPDPKISTPSETEVAETFEGHPVPQCRLDTQIAAALCPIPFDFTKIPGDGLGQSNRSLAAEIDSTNTTCHRARGYNASARPRCWFAPRIAEIP